MPLVLTHHTILDCSLSSFLNRRSSWYVKRFCYFLDSWPLQMEPIGCTETSVRNNRQSLLISRKSAILMLTILFGCMCLSVCVAHSNVWIVWPIFTKFSTSFVPLEDSTFISCNKQTTFSGFGGLEVSVLAFGTRVRGWKNPHRAFLWRGSKAIGPM